VEVVKKLAQKNTPFVEVLFCGYRDALTFATMAADVSSSR